MLEMSQYRDKVFAAARDKTGEAIFNASFEHASIVVEMLFSVAQEQVSIVTGSLNPVVYSNYGVMAQAVAFASQSGRRLRIILEEGDRDLYAFNPFIQVMKKFTSMELRLISPHLKSRYRFHFTLADSDSYRFEEDRRSPEAIASFGNPTGGESLQSIFTDLWQKAERFGLPA